MTVPPLKTWQAFVTITRDGVTRVWCLACSWRTEAEDDREAWTVAQAHGHSEHHEAATV